MAFTLIGAGVDWQAASFCNEYRNAQNERSQAIGGAAVADIAAGEDIQDKDFWKAFQEWQETNCTSFVDHNAVIPGQASVPLLTLAAWQADAGLNVSATPGQSFRRATSWSPPAAPSYSYGYMQAGDIIGPWIFEDLQAGFKSLKWTTESGNYYTDEEIKHQGNSDVDTCINVRDAHINHATWDPGAAWVGNVSGVVAMNVGYCVDYGGGVYQWGAWRVRAKPMLVGVYDGIESSADIYYIPDAHYDWYEFTDCDNAGMVINELWFHETLAAEAVSTKTGNAYDPDHRSPVETHPLTCAGHMTGSFTQYGINVFWYQVRWVLKWVFTES